MTEFHVYRHFDVDGNLLYVGCTSNLKARKSQHRAVSKWWPVIDRIETEGPMIQRDALDAERKAIEDERPGYNVRHSKNV